MENKALLGWAALSEMEINQNNKLSFIKKLLVLYILKKGCLCMQKFISHSQIFMGSFHVLCMTVVLATVMLLLYRIFLLVELVWMS